MKVDHNILELSTLQAAKRNKEKNARTTGVSAPGEVEGKLGTKERRKNRSQLITSSITLQK